MPHFIWVFTAYLYKYDVQRKKCNFFLIKTCDQQYIIMRDLKMETYFLLALGWVGHERGFKTSLVGCTCTLWRNVSYHSSWNLFQLSSRFCLQRGRTVFGVCGQEGKFCLWNWIQSAGLGDWLEYRSISCSRLHMAIFGPRRRGFVRNKGSDQPAHPRRLISAFVVQFVETMIS